MEEVHEVSGNSSDREDPNDEWVNEQFAQFQREILEGDVSGDPLEGAHSNNDDEQRPLRRQDYSGYFDVGQDEEEVQDRYNSSPDVRINMRVRPIALTHEQVNQLNAIAELIPEYTPYGQGSFVRGGAAFVVAATVSVTGFRVAGRYAGIWATALGWNPDFLVIVSAGSNIIANIFVRSIRIISATNILKRMIARWDENRMPLPDDKFIRKTIFATGFVSFIAALPWFALVFQDLPEPLWAKILTGLFIATSTLLVEGSLALCSFTDYFEFDHQRREAVIQWKRKILIELRSLMSDELRELYSEEMLEQACHGEVYVVSEESREFRLGVGKFLAFLASPYSIIVGYGVYRIGLQLLGTYQGPCLYVLELNGGFFNTLLNFCMTGVMGISIVARLGLLAIANERLATQVLAANDRPLFNMGGYEVVTPVIESENIRNFGGMFLILFCFIIGFFSVGTASGLSLKNLFCDEGTILNLLISFLIGTGGAFGINISSVYNTIVSMGTDAIRYRNTRSRNYNSRDRLGETSDEMLLIASHQVASLSNDAAAENNLIPFDTGFRGDPEIAEERGLSKTQIKALEVNRRVGIYPNYSDNGRAQELNNATAGLRRTNGTHFFGPWREGDYVVMEGADQQQNVRRRRVVPEEEESNGIPLQEMHRQPSNAVPDDDREIHERDDDFDQSDDEPENDGKNDNIKLL